MFMRKKLVASFIRPYVVLNAHDYWNTDENTGKVGRIIIGTHISEQRGFNRSSIIGGSYIWNWKTTRMMSIDELRSSIHHDTKQQIFDVLVKEINSPWFTEEYSKYREMTRRFSIDKVLSLPTNMIDVKYVLEVLGASEIAKKL